MVEAARARGLRVSAACWPCPAAAMLCARLHCCGPLQACCRGAAQAAGLQVGPSSHPLPNSVCPSSHLLPPVQVMTYGLPNDDPEWVRSQQRMGVQGVIVDDVAGVAAALSATA